MLFVLENKRKTSSNIAQKYLKRNINGRFIEKAKGLRGIHGHSIVIR